MHARELHGNGDWGQWAYGGNTAVMEMKVAVISWLKFAVILQRWG